MRPYLTLLLKWLAGPVVFSALYSISFEGLSPGGHLIVATFAWMLTWWMVQPVPWAITSLLPLIVFPVFRVMNIADTARLYGQPMFFWLMGLVLLGHAMEKHGLAKRFALALLSLNGRGATSQRLVFLYLLATFVISMFISNAATVAMMTPIGLSLLACMRSLTGASGAESETTRLANLILLGTLYAATAGGLATIAGIPLNAVGVAVLERLTGESIGWFRWMLIGVPLSVLVFLAFYVLLRLFFPPELTTIPGGQAFIRQQTRELGRMNRAETNVLLIFATMVLLFALPSVVPLVAQPSTAVAKLAREALSIWIVPPIILFLLFALPIDVKKSEFTLTWKDAAQHTPWNIILLVCSALGITDALGTFGFLEFMRGVFSELRITTVTLPFIVGFSVAASTQIVSGTAVTALAGNIFIPAAVHVGFNPASIAMLIPHTALGIVFPWSGATSATAFASGKIAMRDMIIVGIIADLLLALIVVVTHIALAPVF